LKSQNNHWNSFSQTWTIKKGEGVSIWNGWVRMEGQRLEFKKVTWVGGCDNLRGRTSRNNEQEQQWLGMMVMMNRNDEY
jgi:hypothetical protein